MREDKPGADSPPEPPTATSRDHATNSGPNDVSPGQIAPAPPKSSSNKGGIVSRIGGTIFRALLCALGVLVCLLGEVAFMVSGWVAIVVVGGVLTNGVNAATAGIGPLMVATTTTAILTATGLAMVVAAFWNRKPEDSSADAPSAETRAQT